MAAGRFSGFGAGSVAAAPLARQEPAQALADRGGRLVRQERLDRLPLFRREVARIERAHHLEAQEAVGLLRHLVEERAGRLGRELVADRIYDVVSEVAEALQRLDRLG